jgi:acyl phosphate:glycerol-3-phosphate acyltransferase
MEIKEQHIHLRFNGYNQIMSWITYALFAFFLGSLPFSVWLGRLVLDIDVRRFGDGNPGTVNVFRAGSKIVGLLTLLLDISKAAAPIGFAYFNLGIRGLPMFFISIAPVLGHAFSPFLRFRGGKALAPALGVWIGLTIWKISLPAVIGALIGLGLFTMSGWAVMVALGAILFALVVWLPDSLLLSVWAVQALILAWTHRMDLRSGFHLRPWFEKSGNRLNKEG